MPKKRSKSSTDAVNKLLAKEPIPEEVTPGPIQTEIKVKLKE